MLADASPMATVQSDLGHDVSKRKSAGKTPNEDQHKGTPITLRFPDARLLDAAAEFGRLTKRSRNMALIVLIEESLRREGLWPPGQETGQGA